ncbi:hypothetical protein AAC899_09240 [Acinetobacter soli]|uniref:hypothetical protein n=1 Tax=Acinetobacter soli TaxID=487316 RepID=UPI0031BB762C
MKTKTKKIYFTNDFSAKNVEKLQSEGWILRNASAVQESDFIETADEYGGKVPEHYKAQADTITVNINTEVAPELQQAIDDAKAECEKLVMDNDSLKRQVEALHVVHRENSELVSENSRLKEQLLLANDALNQTTTERDDAVSKVQSLEKTVGELESKVKKLTAAEAKAAKAVDAGTQKE